MPDLDTPQLRAERTAILQASSALRRQSVDQTHPARVKIDYATSALLEAVNRILTTQPQDLPTSIRDTAIRLADLINHASRASDNPITHRQLDPSSLLELRRADAGDIAAADRMQLPG
jgi:hypothetical protein